MQAVVFEKCVPTHSIKEELWKIIRIEVEQKSNDKTTLDRNSTIGKSEEGNQRQERYHKKTNQNHWPEERNSR